MLPPVPVVQWRWNLNWPRRKRNTKSVIVHSPQWTVVKSVASSRLVYEALIVEGVEVEAVSVVDLEAASGVARVVGETVEVQEVAREVARGVAREVAQEVA
jgi:hypothetical protein